METQCQAHFSKGLSARAIVGIIFGALIFVALLVGTTFAVRK